MDVWLNTWATAPADRWRACSRSSRRCCNGLVSPWYRSVLGTVFFRPVRRVGAGVRPGLVRRIVATIASGGPQTSGDGLGALAFAVYTFVAVVSGCWCSSPSVRERRHTPTPTPPIERRHDSRAAAHD